MADRWSTGRKILIIGIPLALFSVLVLLVSDFYPNRVRKMVEENPQTVEAREAHLKLAKLYRYTMRPEKAFDVYTEYFKLYGEESPVHDYKEFMDVLYIRTKIGFGHVSKKDLVQAHQDYIDWAYDDDPRLREVMDKKQLIRAGF